MNDLELKRKNLILSPVESNQYTTKTRISYSNEVFCNLLDTLTNILINSSQTKREIIRGNSWIYEGEVENAKMHGKGVYKNAENFTYDGEWKFGVKEGRGVCRYSNGGIYEGEWINDKRQGKGVYKYPNGNTYEGDWETERSKEKESLSTLMAIAMREVGRIV